MNIAEAQSQVQPASSGGVIRVEKPDSGRAAILPVPNGVVLDLSPVAGETLTFLRADDRLIILFADRASVTLVPFFAADGTARDDLTLRFGPGPLLNGDDLAALFPIATDQSLLPAAGPIGSGGIGRAPVQVEDLAGAANRLALLGGEDAPDPGALTARVHRLTEEARPVPAGTAESVAPSAQLAIAADRLNAQDGSTVVTITFSEAVSGFEIGDLQASGGTLTGFTQQDALTYTVTFTGTLGFTGTGSVTLAGGSYTDLTGLTIRSRCPTASPSTGGLRQSPSTS